jgi:Tetracyclin repressor-like, C-terminal domain
MPDPSFAASAGVRNSQERVLDAVRRVVDSGRFPGRAPEAVVAQLWALVHGLASIELRGYLGGEQQAARHWRDAVAAALLGYQQPPPQDSA